MKKARRVPPLAGVRACACACVSVRVTARACARTRAPEGPVPERGGGRQCEVDVGACTVDLGYSRVLTQRYSADGFAAQGARTRTVHRMGYLLEGVLGAPHRRLTRSVGALNGYGGTRGVLMGTRNVLKLPSPQQGTEGVMERSQGLSVPFDRAVGAVRTFLRRSAAARSRRSRTCCNGGYADYKCSRTWRAYNRN